MLRLEICENDAPLYEDGIAKLVVIEISDGKKTVRVPFSAETVLSDIIRSCNSTFEKMQNTSQARDVVPVPQRPLAGVGAEQPRIPPHGSGAALATEVPTPAGFSPGDVVLCLIDIKPDSADGKGDPQEIFKGREYRILSRHLDRSVTPPIVMGYDIIDDTAATPRRLPIKAESLQLVRTAPPKPPRKIEYEMIGKCPACAKEVALSLRDDAYVGKCEYCSGTVTQPRPTVEVGNA